MPRDKRKVADVAQTREERVKPQLALFETGKSWENEWKGMPEFDQKNLKSFKDIKVHFYTREDMEAFAELLDQRITMDTQYIWFPEQTINRYINMRYVDKEPVSQNPVKEIPEGTEIVE